MFFISFWIFFIILMLALNIRVEQAQTVAEPDIEEEDDVDYTNACNPEGLTNITIDVGIENGTCPNCKTYYVTGLTDEEKTTILE